MNRNVIIAIAVGIIVVLFAVTVFTATNQAPTTDGGETANNPAEQESLPAGPADVPPVLTE
jgi:hypothetical protein